MFTDKKTHGHETRLLKTPGILTDEARFSGESLSSYLDDRHLVLDHPAWQNSPSTPPPHRATPTPQVGLRASAEPSGHGAGVGGQVWTLPFLPAPRGAAHELTTPSRQERIWYSAQRAIRNFYKTHRY